MARSLSHYDQPFQIPTVIIVKEAIDKRYMLSDSE